MTPAAIAAGEFTSRRAWLAGQVEQRLMAEREANDRLRPWLHIAAMAGARIEAVHEAGVIVFPFERAGEDVAIPLILSLSQAQRHAARAELARARDAAILAAGDRGEAPGGNLFERAQGLVILARHLGAPPYLPSSSRASTRDPAKQGAAA